MSMPLILLPTSTPSLPPGERPPRPRPLSSSTCAPSTAKREMNMCWNENWVLDACRVSQKDSM